MSHPGPRTCLSIRALASTMILLGSVSAAQSAVVQSSLDWEVVNSGFDSSIPAGFQGTNVSNLETGSGGSLVSLGLEPYELPQPDGAVPGGPLPDLEGLALVDGRRLHAYARTALPEDACSFGEDCGITSGTILWNSSWEMTSFAYSQDDVVISAGPAFDGLPGLVRIAWRLDGYLFDRSVGTQNIGEASVSAGFGLQSVVRSVRAIAANEPDGAEDLIEVESLNNFRFVFGETFPVAARLESSANVNVQIDDPADAVTTLSDFASTLEFGPILEVLVDTDQNGSFETVLSTPYTVDSALGLDYSAEPVPEPGLATGLGLTALAMIATAPRRRASRRPGRSDGTTSL